MMAAPAVAAMAPEIIGAGAAPAAAGLAAGGTGLASLFGPAAGSLGAALGPAAASSIPLGMTTMGAGAGAAFGLPSLTGALSPSATGAAGLLTGKQMIGMGANMLHQGMQPPQPSPLLAQRPPSMQQQQPAPAGVQGMLNQPMQGMQGGAGDIMARLRAMGMMQ